MTAAAKVIPLETASDKDAWFARARTALRAGEIAPFIGPGILSTIPDIPIPTSYEKLAEFIGTKVALPKRTRGNAWSSAQFVEGRQHRASVTALLKQAFAPEVAPTPFHKFLVDLAPPLIIDTWYDGALRGAFHGKEGFAELQGNTRAAIGEARWFRAYDSTGIGIPAEEAAKAKTIVYKPHGGVVPAGNFLISDADYVEVLTEIDIQSPIPASVQERRTNLGFLFIGCHFHDQMLRTYGRQIQKRSKGPNYAIFDDERLTKMERRFAHEIGLDVIICPIQEAMDRLMA